MRRETGAGLGKRMRQAAKERGLTAIDIAGKLHTSDVTVRRWWTGDRQPRPELLAQYAEVVGKSLAWFHRPDDGVVTEEAQRILLDIMDLVMDGRDVVSAAERAVGGDLEVTAGQRRMLASQSDNIRAVLNGYADGAWDQLTAAQKAQIVAQVAAMAAENARR